MLIIIGQNILYSAIVHLIDFDNKKYICLKKERKMNSNREIEWINFAKFIAIVAVLFNHSYGVLYFNERICTLSYFSVSLFILISGILSYKSIIKHQLSWFKTFWRSIKKIIIAYLVSTLIYYVWINKFFDLSQYTQLILNFNISGPFYYVALYIQLMLISKPLFNIIDKIPMTKKRYNY